MSLQVYRIAGTIVFDKEIHLDYMPISEQPYWLKIGNIYDRGTFPRDCDLKRFSDGKAAITAYLTAIGNQLTILNKAMIDKRLEEVASNAQKHKK